MKYLRSYILFLIVLSVGLLTACSGEDSPGSVEEPPTEDPLPISFVGAGAEAQTRAIGSSLSQYAKDFRLYGVNYKSGASSCDLVFQNYVVWYDAAAGSTSTNSSAWEYVGTHPATASPASTDPLYTSSDKINSDGTTSGSTTWQSIKYWDQSADYYYFWGIAKAAHCTSMTPESSSMRRVASLQFSLSSSDLSDTHIPYFTDPVYVPKANYGQPVEMPFKRLTAQIRIGFYETIEQALVSDLKFYTTIEGGAQSPVPILRGDFANEAQITLTFNYSPTEHPTTVASSKSANLSHSKILTGALDYSSGETSREEDTMANKPSDLTSYLAHTSIAPTYVKHDGDPYYTIIPYNNTAGLSLLCDYTVTKTDKANRKPSVVEQMPATVPAAYCNWQPNYLYTYIFKITDEGDGGIVLHDVKIVPWTESGTAEQEWHNW